MLWAPRRTGLPEGCYARTCCGEQALVARRGLRVSRCNESKAECVDYTAAVAYGRMVQSTLVWEARIRDAGAAAWPVQAVCLGAKHIPRVKPGHARLTRARPLLAGG